MNYIKQEQSHGCGIASLAMILGLSYKDVVKDWRLVVEKDICDGKEYEQRYNDFDHGGLSHMCIDAYLADKGYATRRMYRHQSFLRADRADWPPLPFGPVHICDVRTSMGHVVVMLDTGEVYDPWYGTGRKLSDYEQVYSVAAVYKVETKAAP